MRKNASEVIDAFKRHEYKQGATIWTDGKKVYSYAMVIGEHKEDSVWIAPYENAPSNTTRSHIRALQHSFR